MPDDGMDMWRFPGLEFNSDEAVTDAPIGLESAHINSHNNVSISDIGTVGLQ